MSISCKTLTCSYNENGLCQMYNEERDDKIRTIEFYEKWNKNKLPPKPKYLCKQEGDM